MRAARRRQRCYSSLTLYFVGGVCGLVTCLVDFILDFVGSRLLAAVLNGVNHVIDFFARLLNRALFLAGADAQCEHAQGKRQYLSTIHLVLLKISRFARSSCAVRARPALKLSIAGELKLDF